MPVTVFSGGVQQTNTSTTTYQVAATTGTTQFNVVQRISNVFGPIVSVNQTSGPPALSVETFTGGVVGPYS